MSKGLDASIGAVNIGTMSTSSIALSGMNAAMIQLDVSAHNIANAMTPGFTRQGALFSAVGPTAAGAAGSGVLGCGLL